MCVFSGRTHHKDTAGVFVYQPPHAEDAACQKQTVEFGVESGEHRRIDQ